MSKNPADGERSAASGYRAQYLVGASIVLDSLNNKDLEWIRIADPDIGRVDDLQVAVTARIDAYQVKWEQYPGTITYNDITKDNDSAPSLITQLADGWKRLKEKYPTHRVVVHLVTNKFASSSTSGSMPEHTSPPSPYHFAAFIERAWKPAHSKGMVEIGGTWEPVWKELQNKSGLISEDFEKFVLDCSFDFQRQVSELNDDVKTIADLLFDTSASPERIVELSKSELIGRLGWGRRYSTWNVHEFPEPQYTYQPLQSTIDDLLSCLEKLPGGYIGVFGSPGSGKSTLLTQTLRKLPVRLVRYYAYVPDSQDPSAVRGESISFLHDITLKLTLAGIRGKGSEDRSDRISLLNLFYEQITRLGVDFQDTGEKTVIMIDGLDHISREQHPDRSLLHDIPLPQDVPDGVYIILGSQTDELSDLRTKVYQELRDNSRRVEMGKFSPGDIRKILLAALPDLSDDEINRIFMLSDGHPLALIYLLKEIQQTKDEKERVIFFEQSEPFKGDIEDQYWSHWHQFEEDEELRFALGLLCRTRGPIPMEWVATWAENSLLRKIQRLFLTYFESDSQDRWIFFHNSFRLFLISRTSEPLPGQTKEQINKSLHLELASRYKESDIPWCWETLYHYYFAGDHEAVVTLATWEWFLQQAISLRPLDAVQTDIRLALKSAGKCKDIVLLARLTLLGAAIKQRIGVLEDYHIVDLLLSCAEPGLAADHLRDGNRLRVNIESALRNSTELVEAGLSREARRVFELAEPHELLSGRLVPDDPTRSDNMWNDLRAWVVSAIHFRTIKEIIESIKRIRISPRWNDDRDNETVSRELHEWLIYQGALACCERFDWIGWKEFNDALDSDQDQAIRFLTLLRSTEYAQRSGDAERFQELLSDLLSSYPPSYFQSIEYSQWSLEGQISLAELLIHDEDSKQTAKSYIDPINPIPLYNSDLVYDDKPLQQKLRFRLARLQYFLGNSMEPSQMLKDAEDVTEFLQHTSEEQKQGYRHVALAIYSLARLWAWGRMENSLSSVTFIQETRWIIDLFGPRWDDWSRQSRLYVGESRFDIFNCVILAAQQHGNEVLEVVKDDFETRWLDHDEAEKWWAGLQRKIINALLKAGIKPEWASDQIKRISHLKLKSLDMYGRVDDCKAQAESWLLLGEKELAFAELRKMINAARGIKSEKDYQLNEWVKWLGKICELEPDKLPERIQLMVRRIVSVQNIASGVNSSAEDILGIVFQHSPFRAVKLWKSMLEANLVGFKDALIALLTTALDSSKPPIEEIIQIILELILPFFPGSTPEILEKLIIVLGNKESKSKASEIGQKIIDRIEIDVLSTDRVDWINGIILGLKKIGLTQDTVKYWIASYEEKSGEHASQLDRDLFLTDGSVFTSKEVLSTVNSINDLERILKNEDNTRKTYFDWAEVAESLAPKLVNKKQLVDLENLITGRLSTEVSRETYLGRLHNAICQRFIDFGDLDSAWEHATKALDVSSPSGWISYWDGGIRLKSLQHQKEIDPEKNSEMIYDLYATDTSEKSYYPENLIQNLFEVFEIICDDIPIVDIWAEIKDYLNDLFVCVNVESVPELESALIDFDDMPEHDNQQRAMIQILILCLSFPSYTIAQAAVTGLTELIIASNELTVDIINSELNSENDVLIERLLIVLDAISKNNHENSLLAFSDILNDLCQSQNFSIRLIACTLISKMKNSSFVIGNNDTQLPTIYQIELPETSHHETWKEMQGERSPILMGDLARRIRPFDEELRVIARNANLPVENVLYRAVHFFETFLVERYWLDDERPLTEKRLIAFLENTGVKSSHSKPHIFAARQALAYVVAELWDCGYLGMDSIGTIQLMLINYDPDLVTQKPSARPKYISPIGNQTTRDAYYRFPENWIEQAKESISLLSSKTEKDQILLGESTHIKYLQEDWPTEIRFSVVKAISPDRFWDVSDIMKGNSPFYKEVNKPAIIYPEIRAPVDQLIVRNRTLGFETAGTNWLALNPLIGYELGWKLDSEGLFQWLDGLGNVVVKSIWWRDGCIELYDRFSRTEVAEGWLVLVTNNGFEEIKEMTSFLHRGKVVSRRIGWLGNKGSHTESKITPIDIEL
ncbi:MAG: AAA family ATPase [Candidatus Hodarchaeales archaeon]